MKKLYIIKIGTTFRSVKERLGDFDQWTADALGPIGVNVGTVDAEHGEPLPEVGGCAGVVITGSHTMVTDNMDWSLRLEEWLKALLEAQVPIFGICYGHQLLARAAGGEVGFHSEGIEIGTVMVWRLPECSSDPLFAELPESFPAHTTHSQTVLKLPSRAVRLAANEHEANHAFRLGACAWGVQFHPEYTAEIMLAYIREQTKEIEAAGRGVSRLMSEVSETPIATGILKRFGEFVEGRLTEDGLTSVRR